MAIVEPATIKPGSVGNSEAIKQSGTTAGADLGGIIENAESKKRGYIQAKLRSVFLTSLAIFLALNAYLSFAGPIHFDPYKFNYKGWMWWTMDDLRNHNNTVHNIALLGSSTMVSASNAAEANYTNQHLDLTAYHRMRYLDDRLSKALGGHFDTFNLSAPGQMPSDAFLTLKAMTLSGNRPDVVIYGVAPRDFTDSTLAGPNDTEPYRYLTRIVNIDDVAKHVFRNPFSKMDWFLQRIFFIYGWALDFRMVLGEATEVALNRILPPPYTNKPFTWWDRVRMIPNYLPAEIHAEAVKVSPMDEKTARSRYTDNTIEYLQRYKKPDPHNFQTQMYFLRKLAQYCHKERIELILVNMPITLQNVQMLPSGHYPAYLQALRAFAWNNNIVYYDLCNFPQYPQWDFHDSVHLNAFGGKKFFDELIAAMLADRRAKAHLEMSGMQMKTHMQLATPLKPEDPERKTF